ncbi:MAG: hypothetical protein RJA99_512 [Pseudomonadota bacterium]|jgi:hypothetical protein
MARCLVLAHPQPRDTGDYRHRITLPFGALAESLEVAEMQTTHPAWVAHAVSADLLMVAMVADDALDAVLAERRRRGRPTVYELSDDFADFPPSLPGHAFHSNPANQATIVRLARAADLLQCSSHGLLERYGALNPRCAVVSNQLAEVPPLPPLPPDRMRVPVLGWAASLGHADDARELARLLRGWHASRGWHPHEAPPLRLMAPTGIRTILEQAGVRVDAVAPAGFDAYLAFLSSIDVGFAVIGDTSFARCRSDGKFLEYASRGVACIASARGEYLQGIGDGWTGRLFADDTGFASALDALWDRPAERLRLRGAAHAHVARERTHEAGSIRRFGLYAGLLRDAGIVPRPGDGRLHTLADATEPTLVQSTIDHARGRLPEALRGYLAVLARHPGFHLPWARAAMVAHAMGAADDAARFETQATRALADALVAPAIAALPA